jgi:hypothetical protein
MFTTADVNIHALIAKYGIDIQIVRPEMAKFKMFLNKVVATFEKHIFLSQTDLTRTGIISNSYNDHGYKYQGVRSRSNKAPPPHTHTLFLAII